MEQKIIADVYRLGLLIHFFTVEEVIHWVDHYIEKNDVKDIPFAFFDLSLTKDRGRAIELLSQISHGYKGALSIQILLGLVYHNWNDANAKSIINEVNQLASLMNSDLLLSGTLMALVDQYEEALKGYGNPRIPEHVRKKYEREAIEEIKDVLAHYETDAMLWGNAEDFMR
ncbi:hypothetical protein [Virgibacillus sp. Bac330]|uniref:hypothetical protein n=1 Tax=Virgibacillus sp. Bac330 TaxID=2419841 RepID=UPI000EF499FF|nr:hypothetical protein [Virgibacillus sp. Bac330]